MVDEGERDEGYPAIPKLIEGHRECTRPAALDGQRILSDNAGYLVSDDRDDPRERLALVAGIGLANEAFIGSDADDDGRTVRHPVVAAPVLLRERREDRNQLDIPDRKAFNRLGQPRLATGENVLVETDSGAGNGASRQGDEPRQLPRQPRCRFGRASRLP